MFILLYNGNKRWQMKKIRIETKCYHCGKTLYLTKYRYERSKTHYCNKKCYFESDKPNRKDKVKALYRTTNNGRLKHRAILEKKLGRKLTRFEFVHHINGDKQDNRLKNLQILTPQEHNDIHLSKYPKTKICVICGNEFTPAKTKRKRNKICSSPDCWEKIVQEKAEERKIPILQLAENEEIIKKWKSGRDIQNTLGYAQSNINKCCRGNIKRAYGYKWKYENSIRKDI